MVENVNDTKSYRGGNKMLNRKVVAQKILDLANEILEETGNMETAEEVVKAVGCEGFDYEFVDEEDYPHFEMFPRY